MITRTTRNLEQNANIRRNQPPLLPQWLRILISFESRYQSHLGIHGDLAASCTTRPISGRYFISPDTGLSMVMLFLFSIFLFSTICSARLSDACQALHKPRVRTISLKGNEEIHTQWQQGHIRSRRVVSPDVCLVRIIVYLRLIQQCEIWPWRWIGWAIGGMK